MQPDLASEAPASAPNDDELLAAGDRVAQLLEEVRAMVGPSVWPRVEELVQRLLELYGAGLERVVRHAVAVERSEGAVAERLRGDELVSSLLLLHGLHPAPTAERVELALCDAAARLGTHELELVAIEPDGSVRLRARAKPRTCPSSGPTIARAIERLVIEAAPEVARVRVELEGVDAGAAAAAEGLVQLGARGGSP